jgi:hypothetical protein
MMDQAQMDIDVPVSPRKKPVFPVTFETRFTIFVEADDQAQAEDAAWDSVERGEDIGDWGDGEWECKIGGSSKAVAKYEVVGDPLTIRRKVG